MDRELNHFHLTSSENNGGSKRGARATLFQPNAFKGLINPRWPPLDKIRESQRLCQFRWNSFTEQHANCFVEFRREAFFQCRLNVGTLFATFHQIQKAVSGQFKSKQILSFCLQSRTLVYWLTLTQHTWSLKKRGERQHATVKQRCLNVGPELGMTPFLTMVWYYVYYYTNYGLDSMYKHIIYILAQSNFFLYLLVYSSTRSIGWWPQRSD